MALGNRCKFTIEFEVDLDLFPGWGHSPEDWHQLAMEGVVRQKHYHTTAKVVKSAVFPKPDKTN